MRNETTRAGSGFYVVALTGLIANGCGSSAAPDDVSDAVLAAESGRNSDVTDAAREDARQVGADATGLDASSSDASETDTSPSPPPVAPCNALPATGMWEVASPRLTSATTWTGAIIMDPFDPGVLWTSANNMTTDAQGNPIEGTDGGIYKSSDCASTWTLVSTGRNSDLMGLSGALSMVFDPQTQGIIYATAGSESAGNAGLWKSTDGGVDWDQLFPMGSAWATYVQYNLVSSVGMEANNPLHLVVSAHAQCEPPYGPVCEAESTDGGATWTITTVPIPGLTTWVAGAGGFILDANSWLFSTYSNGLWLTRDRGGHFTNVAPTGSTGVTNGKVIDLPFAPGPGGMYYLGGMEGVLTSPDGLSWSLIQSTGRATGLAFDTDRIFVSDQWSPSYHVADANDPTTWTSIPPPAGVPSTQGAPYVAYDTVHHVLYASSWSAGLYRRVTP